MSLVLDDLPRDPEWLQQQLRQVAEVATTERSRHIALEIERDTAMAERNAVRAERDAAQAEIEKLRLLIRQLQRGRFGGGRAKGGVGEAAVLDPAAAAGAVRPPLREARSRPAPARPGRPRAD